MPSHNRWPDNRRRSCGQAKRGETNGNKTADIDVEVELSAEAEETGSGMDEDVARGLACPFVRDGMTGYTIGVDWNDADRFDTVAMRILESFAVQAITDK